MNKNKANILVGVSGSISLINVPSYLGYLKYKYGNVQIIMSHSANKLVPASTMQLFCDAVHLNEENHASNTNTQHNTMSHIELARWADAFIIIPATANKISEAAAGLGADLMTTTLLAYKGKAIFLS
ncbi:flavoprotein [Geomicrobium sp. JCM 19055]|uniref:flavoprotein n=1 Tax=Geomicrobium sp. JCM 19055 TaxID=1460649 RepID=UPI00069502D4|nr:flavoprotein [Geomicrobium sp. JCM 19055]